MKAVAGLLLLLAAFAARAAAPTEVTAEYKLSINGFPGARVQESYVRKGDAYSIESKSTTEGPLKALRDETLTYTSTGRVGSGGLVPLVFERRQLADRSRDVRATFDWSKGLMRSEYRGEASDVELPRGTQDRLSMMYQFMHMAPGGSTVEASMSNGRKVEHYTYRLVEEARLKTPAGEFDTLHYERVVKDPGHGKAELWLARDHHNLPVRVVFEDAKGLRLDQTLVLLQAR
jgi:hypothetical protein